MTVYFSLREASSKNSKPKVMTGGRPRISDTKSRILMFRAPFFFQKFSKILAKSLTAFVLVATLFIYIFANIISDQNPVKAIGSEITVSPPSGATKTTARIPHQVCAFCHLDNGALVADSKSNEPTKNKPCIECHSDVSSSSGDPSATAKQG